MSLAYVSGSAFILLDSPPLLLVFLLSNPNMVIPLVHLALCRPDRASRLVFACCHPAQQMLHLAAEDEVAIAEQLLRARLVEMGEENLSLDRHLAADHDAPFDGRAFRTKVLDLHLVDQLLAGKHVAVEDCPRNLGEYNFLLKVVDLPD